MDLPKATFRPHERLNDPASFRRAFERKRSASDASLIVYGSENGLSHARLGISVSRKRIRKASDRNEAKRYIREAFRLNKASFPPGIDYVVVPRGKGLTFASAHEGLPRLAHSVARRLGFRPDKAVP